MDCCSSDDNSSADSSSDDNNNNGDSPVESKDTSKTVTPTHEPFLHSVCLVPPPTQFQLKLEKIRNSHCTDQTLFNDVIEVVKEFSVDLHLLFPSHRLKGRGQFLTSLEKKFNTTKPKSKNVPVKFSDETVGVLSVFDIEEQLNALLTNPELMQEKNNLLEVLPSFRVLRPTRLTYLETST